MNLFRHAAFAFAAALSALAAPAERERKAAENSALLLDRLYRRSDARWGAKSYRSKSRYWPHQGERECARRVRQMAKAQATATARAALLSK